MTHKVSLNPNTIRLGQKSTQVPLLDPAGGVTGDLVNQVALWLLSVLNLRPSSCHISSSGFRSLFWIVFKGMDTFDRFCFTISAKKKTNFVTS